MSSIIILLLSLSSPTFANDGVAALGAGGIELGKSEDISMEDELLTISQELVEVKYKFKNNSDKEISALIFFPLPPLKCGSFERNETVDNFIVKVNGSKVKYETETKAILYSLPNDNKKFKYKKGQDVTDILHKNKIDLDCRKLKDYEPAQKFGLAKAPINDPGSIDWSTNIKYYWTQKFLPQETLTIEHQYKPVRGTSVISGNYVDYILKTANTWKGPIGHFKLIIKTIKENPVTINMPGLKRKSEILYELEKTAFTPKSDLKVTFKGSGLMEPPAKVDTPNLAD